MKIPCNVGGRVSSIAIAARSGIDAPGIESRWGWDFWCVSRPAPSPPCLLYNG